MPAVVTISPLTAKELIFQEAFNLPWTFLSRFLDDWFLDGVKEIFTFWILDYLSFTCNLLFRNNNH